MVPGSGGRAAERGTSAKPDAPSCGQATMFPTTNTRIHAFRASPRKAAFCTL